MSVVPLNYNCFSLLVSLRARDASRDRKELYIKCLQAYSVAVVRCSSVYITSIFSSFQMSSFLPSGKRKSCKIGGLAECITTTRHAKRRDVLLAWNIIRKMKESYKLKLVAFILKHRKHVDDDVGTDALENVHFYQPLSHSL